MGRRIKFRAWNKRKNIMVYGDEDNSSGFWDGVCASIIEIINIELNSEINKETYDFMQYTGLHDKNGKEIYEGDIVKAKHNNCIYIGKVKYDEEHCEYRIELVDAYINLWKKLDLEVIGNIYENKELLEG